MKSIITILALITTSNAFALRAGGFNKTNIAGTTATNIGYRQTALPGLNPVIGVTAGATAINTKPANIGYGYDAQGRAYNVNGVGYLK